MNLKMNTQVAEYWVSEALKTLGEWNSVVGNWQRIIQKRLERDT